MKQLILFSGLLLCLAAGAAAQGRVEFSACFEGSTFTLTVPIDVPEGTLVEYQWYRGSAAIAGAVGNFNTAAANRDTIRYTIPADSAYGVGREFYFSYRLNGGAESGVSPTYVVGFHPPAEGGEPPVCGGTIPGAVGAICGTMSGLIGNTCNTTSGNIGNTCGTTPGAIGS
jgi:hypothetical protein